MGKASRSQGGVSVSKVGGKCLTPEVLIAGRGNYSPDLQGGTPCRTSPSPPNSKPKPSISAPCCKMLFWRRPDISPNCSPARTTANFWDAPSSRSAMPYTGSVPAPWKPLLTSGKKGVPGVEHDLPALQGRHSLQGVPATYRH